MSVAETAAPPVAVVGRPVQPRLVSSRLVRSELSMVFRRRRNQAILVVLASIPILIAVAVRISAPSGNEGPPFLSQITSNGVFVALTALTVVLPFFLPLAVSVVSGDAVASEASLGTLRYLLAVPVSRARLLLVKYVGVVAYCLAATLVVATVGLLIGLALFPVGRVTLLSGTEISYASGLGRLLLVALYVAAAMAAVGAIGMFVSTLTESPVAAMATTAVLAIASQVLDSVPQLHAIHPWLFSHYWLNYGDLLRDPIATDGLFHGLLAGAAYLAVFGSLAWARFSGKDVSS
jgi:ABC-2 type transport system permease protein